MRRGFEETRLGVERRFRILLDLNRVLYRDPVLAKGELQCVPICAEGEGVFSCSPQASFGERRENGVFSSWRSVPVFRSVLSSREFRQGGSRVSRRSQSGLSGALRRFGLPQTPDPKKEVLITGKGSP